ncbi:MAG: hypothetical protein COB49_12860 [Alphaproteobacteria bacterium]|nr:MAG: hypothetical protein COB49_12860 [Alphaproteobacteria bacterium]
MNDLKLSQTMTRYEAELARMVENLAEQIVIGARSRVMRNLKKPKGNSPLAQSIRAEKDPEGGMRVLTDKSYARYVEFGTVNQPARPFLTPAAAEVRVTFSSVLER